MAENILRLKVDSQEYDAKLNKATNGLTRYIEGCRKVGGTLEVVEKETLQYVQALGKMGASAGTSRGKLGEMTKAFTELTMQYRHLTNEEKSSPFGKSLTASLDQLRDRIKETKKELKDIEDSLGNDGGSKFVQTMGALSMSVQGAYEGLETLTSSIEDMVGAFDIQEQAELKLETVMRQRMNATEEEIDSIKRLASAQQQAGVIGDEVQLAGAQQVATFLNEKSSIEKLLPAMNNLAVQRQGLNVTSEEMVSIGNLVGKAMQGQASALKRVGITFDETQKKIIETGTEAERAATIAEVITQNVGNMNAEMAKTDAGKAKQMSNAFGDMKEQIGAVFAKWAPLMQGFSQIGMMAMGVGQVTIAVVSVTKAISSWTATTAIANVNTRIASSVVSGLSTRLTFLTAGTTAATVATKALTWALRALEVASVIGGIIAALSIAVEGLGDAFNTSGTAAKANAKQLDAQGTAAESSAARNAKANTRVSNSTASVIANFERLQAEWKALKTTAQQTSWIEKNQSAFSAMGIAVGSVNDAQRTFVNQAPKVIAALKSIAEANAYSELYQDALKKKAQAKRNGSVANGGYYKTAKAGAKMSDEDIASIFRAGLEVGTDYTHEDKWFAKDVFTLKASGAKKLNAYREKQARARNAAYMSPYNDDVKYYGDLFDKAASASADAQSYLNGLGSPYRPTTSTPVRTTGRHTTATPAEKTEEQLNNEKINALTQEYIKATDERRAAIKTEISELQTRNAEIKRLKDEAQGKTVELKVETPKDFSALTQNNIDGFISDLQSRIKEAGIGSTLYDALTEKLRDAQTFGDLLKECMENGVELEDFDAESLWKKILTGSDPEAVTNAFNYALSQLNGTEGVKGLKSIGKDGKLENQDAEEGEGLKEKGEKMLSGLQSVSSGLQSMGIQLPSGVSKVINAAQGLMQVIQGVQSIISIFSTTTATATNAAMTGNTSALLANTGAMISLTSALAFNSAMSAIPFAHGGVVRAAGGFRIPGNSLSGDRVPALVNSGELILNRAQQGNLASQLDEASQGGMSAQPYVDTEKIYLGLNNYGKRRGYGELVFSKNK
jgi:hypothetical protein